MHVVLKVKFARVQYLLFHYKGLKILDLQNDYKCKNAFNATYIKLHHDINSTYARLYDDDLSKIHY